MKTLLYFLLFLFCSTLLPPYLIAVDEAVPAIEQPAPPFHPNDPVFPMDDIIKEPLKQNDKFYSEFLNMLATLGFILALILIAAWFLKRLVNTRVEQANNTSSIKILERRSLSAKSMVYLLEIEGTGILVAESVNGITRLSEFPVASEMNEEKPPENPTSFSKILERK